jgi:hypothetical protein
MGARRLLGLTPRGRRRSAPDDAQAVADHLPDHKRLVIIGLTLLLLLWWLTKRIAYLLGGDYIF